MKPPFEERKYTEAEIAAVIKMQRRLEPILRSNQRKKLHSSLFNTEPVTGWAELNLFAPYHNSDLHHRLEKIILEDIVPNQKIVNGKQLYHYTSLSNLPSIIKSRAMYGNAYLQKTEIPFEANVFDSRMDGPTGDSNVICFCPGQVDEKAFISRLNKVCRLSVDIYRNIPPYTKAKGKYNQFFKLSDLQFKWASELKINTFKAHVSNAHGDGMSIYLSFNEKNHTVILTPNEMVYYGNIFKINRFCSVQLFNIINKVDNAEFKTDFYNHLSALNDDELRKFLIVFSQHLTLFAEANFNTFLSLDDIKINEILFLGDHKIKLDFSKLDDENYIKAFELIAASDFSKLKKLYGKSIHEDNTICVKKNHEGGKSICAFGALIPYNGQWGKQDYTNLPASIFATNKYVEIRVGVKQSPEVGVKQSPEFENQNSGCILS
jgi:hypothetical protein